MSKRVFLMYEPFGDPLLSTELWLKRVRNSVWMAFYIVLCALAIGVVGYHLLGHLNWVDSLLEASMILGGMGPVAQMTGDAVKIFASVYALLSGFLILTTSGIILAPWLHRLIHVSHKLQSDKEESKKKR